MRCDLQKMIHDMAQYSLSQGRIMDLHFQSLKISFSMRIVSLYHFCPDDKPPPVYTIQSPSRIPTDDHRSPATDGVLHSTIGACSLTDCDCGRSDCDTRGSRHRHDCVGTKGGPGVWLLASHMHAERSPFVDVIRGACYIDPARGR